MNRFDGKVAFITGAAGGIGRATAIRFATEGASVYLVDVAAVELEETAKLCEAESAAVHFAACDIRPIRPGRPGSLQMPIQGLRDTRYRWADRILG